MGHGYDTVHMAFHGGVVVLSWETATPQAICSMLKLQEAIYKGQATQTQVDMITHTAQVSRTPADVHVRTISHDPN